MKKSVNLNFHSIRDINDFCSLNRLYLNDVHVSSDISSDNGAGHMVNTVKITAEGKDDAVIGLIDSYRMFGIA